jgi:enolase
VGDEGGFAPHLGSNEKALRILHQTILQSGFAIGKDFNLGLDAAASEFFDTDSEVYHVRASKKTYKPGSMYKLYQKWQRDYGVTIVEDGCAEDDYWGWQALSKHLGQTTTLVGDDVFVTNPERIQLGVISGIANAVLIKPNQIGSVTETVEAIQLAQKYNYQIVVSHRSGETDDTFIADLAVAFGADYIKAGSLARGERIAKYNRLLAIEQELR